MTVLANQEFARVQFIMNRPGVLLVPVIVATEFALAADSPVRQGFLVRQNYYSHMRALLFFIKLVADGTNRKLPKVFTQHQPVMVGIGDALQRMVQAHEYVGFYRRGVRLDARDSVEMQHFANHVFRLSGLGDLVSLDSYVNLRRLADRLRDLRQDNSYSAEGPALFWDFLALPSTHRLFGLPVNLQQRVDLVRRVSKALSLPSVKLPKHYCSEGIRRLAQ